jgi:IS30 family transposase
LTKYIYKASDANIAAADTRSSCRSGINITDEELKELNDLLTPRIQKGQSIHHIMVSEPGVFTISERQAYRLVNNGLIDAKPIDLPRAVRLKPRKKKATEKKVDRNCRKGRTYEDYLNYMTEHPDEPVLQGDTVEGKKGEKCILTLTWVQWSFQVGFLREHNNSASVTLIVNQLYESLGFELFHKVIPSVWLLDNGSEFSDPAEIEKYGIHVFYCDPSAPYQKGCCEVTHEYVRRILPKGTSFQDLDQDYIDFMYSHINSTCRKKLNDHSPFDSFSSVLGSGVLEKYFNITRIDPQSVHLKPSLKAIWDDQRKENN